jgi:hypothetical protein
MHLYRLNRYGDPLKLRYPRGQIQQLCLEQDCDTPVHAEGRCSRHYAKNRYAMTICGVDGCAANAYCRGLCGRHYRNLRNGHPMVPPPEKPRRKWGTGHLQDGYIRIGRPSIAVHRLVMEEMIGRALLPGENVHHRNGIRDDNRPENLELWSRSQPPGQRVLDKLAWAREIVALYGPIENKLD